MKLLAWDTSAKTGTLAAYEWNNDVGSPRDTLRLVSEWTLNVEALHSDNLLWSIHHLVNSARWKIQDIDVFAVGLGPGSFTGLRIGVTTARTLAHTLQKPLIGISSLAALARPASLWLSSRKERVVLAAVTDACKGEIYSLVGSARGIQDCVVLADGDFPGLWKRGVEEAVCTPDGLIKVLKRKLKEGGAEAARSTRWMALGEAVDRYPEVWKALPKSQRLMPPVPFSSHIQGRYVGLLAWEAWQAGLSREALKVHPRYLRAPDAELKLRAGLLNTSPTRIP